MESEKKSRRNESIVNQTANSTSANREYPFLFPLAKNEIRIQFRENPTMVIRSQQPAVARIVSPEADPKRPSDNPALRPRSFGEYVGQRDIVERLRVAVASAKIRKEPLEHVLLYGPPGLGKTTLANIVAHEMAAHLRQTSGPACQKPSDLVSILTGLKEGDILFIDEIHRLPPALEEICYSAMEDRTIDIMIGSGTGAASVTMNVAPFTLIGATTRLSSLSSPLRDRFGNILKLDLYDESHLAHIAARSFGLLGYPDMPPETVSLVAMRGRGTPRIVNRYVKILRDYATIGRDITSTQTVREIFAEIGVDDE
jgi:holliday junction DNA helicase RuvB